jgi:hypothetical protein
MREVCYLDGMSKNLEGDLIISFKVEDSDEIIEDIKKLNNDELVIEVKKHRKSRSLDANAYFWVLCDKIAKCLGTTKDAIYLVMLQSAGVFQDCAISPEGFEKLAEMYRVVDKLYDFEYEFDTAYGVEYRQMVMCRCYLGSHTYNTDEMSRLIEYAVSQATDLHIDVLTPDERNHMLSLWGEKQSKMKL